MDSTQGFEDDVIASRCLDLLRWNSVVPDEQIQIKVQQGWVTLEGDVEWQYQKEAAQNAIQKLDGITGLNNLLVIKPRLDIQDINGRGGCFYSNNKPFSRLRFTSMPGDPFTGLPFTLCEAIDTRSRCNDQTEQ